jgi:hypothetical protein
MPELVVNMLRLLFLLISTWIILWTAKDAMEFNGSFAYKSVVEYFNEKTKEGRLMLRKKIIPYIYPSTYTKNLWQSQKIEITEGFFTRDQDWVHVLHHNSRFSQILLSGTKMLYNSINPRYLNTKGTGFKNINKLYKIGNIKEQL